MGRDGAVRRHVVARGAAAIGLACAAALVSAACATLRGAQPINVGSDETVEVIAGGELRDVDASYVRFFPRSLRVHAGDAIRFTNWAEGEPHTVALGRLVDEAARQIASLGQRPSPVDVANLPAVQALPSPFEATGPTGAAPFAGPCVTSDVGDDDGPGCDTELGDFDGRPALYSTGLLDAGEITTIRLSEDIPPGTYGYVDLAHPEVMWGEIVVVEPGEDVAEPGDAMDRADDELDVAYRTLAGVAPLAAGISATNAVAGIPSEAGFDYLATFGLAPYRITAGDTVTWQIFGTHSITFNPTEEAKDGLVVEVDGELRLNDAAWMPSSPVSQSGTQSARDGVSEITVIDGGTWDGEGFHNSGIFRSFPPSLVSYSLTFSTPGEYSYHSLVSPEMKGTIIVESADGTS